MEIEAESKAGAEGKSAQIKVDLLQLQSHTLQGFELYCHNCPLNISYVIATIALDISYIIAIIALDIFYVVVIISPITLLS